LTLFIVSSNNSRFSGNFPDLHTDAFLHLQFELYLHFSSSSIRPRVFFLFFLLFRQNHQTFHETFPVFSSFLRYVFGEYSLFFIVNPICRNYFVVFFLYFLYYTQYFSLFPNLFNFKWSFFHFVYFFFLRNHLD